MASYDANPPGTPAPYLLQTFGSQTLRRIRMNGASVGILPQLWDEGPGEFGISYRRSGPTAWVWIRGELDLATVDRLTELFAIILAFAQPQAGKVLMDLSKVSFIDCTGYRPIARLADQLARRDGSAVIRDPSPRVIHLLGLMNSVSGSPQQISDDAWQSLSARPMVRGMH